MAGWWKIFKRQNKYAQAKVQDALDQKADPHIQLNQAVEQAQENIARVNSAAASVIANQKQAEMRLHAAQDKEGQLTRSLQAAISQNNEPAQTAFATQLAGVRQQVTDLTQMVLDQTDAAGKAQDAVRIAQTSYQELIAKRQKLEGKLSMAKMQEASNDALSTLTETTVNADVPSMADMEEKIDARYARAIGTSTVQDMSAEKQMLEVHQAEIGAQADDIISQMKQQMGLPAPAPAPAIAATTAEPAAKS